MQHFIVSALLVFSTGAAAIEAWSAEAVAEDHRWRDFVSKTEQLYVRAVDTGALSMACRKVLTSIAEKRGVDPVELCIVTALASLDDESSYLPPKQWADFKAPGPHFVGIGLELGGKAAGVSDLIVVTPIAGGPGDRGGIKPGDRILEIDGTSVAALTMDESVRLLRGPIGSRMTLKLKRAGETIELPFVREEIRIATVRSRLQGEAMAWLRIYQFQKDTPADVRKHLDRLAKPTLSGLVIDLRNNPGGLLDSALQIASLFCEPGTPLLSISGHEGVEQKLSAEAGSPAWFRTVPLVVLVNARTASAAEALAQMLRERRKAQLIGARTFGMGTIHTVLEIGEQAGIRLITGRMDSAEGVSWAPKGLSVDVIANDPPPQVEFGAADDESIANAIRVLRSRLQIEVPLDAASAKRP